MPNNYKATQIPEYDAENHLDAEIFRMLILQLMDYRQICNQFLNGNFGSLSIKKPFSS